MRDRTGGLWQSGEEQTGFKAIYRPQSAGGGGAGSGSSAADTGITNNSTRNPVLLWSCKKGSWSFDTHVIQSVQLNMF